MNEGLTPQKKAKGFIAGFKKFITKGNIIDMAVGVVIGSAFAKIISSLVKDIIMPPIAVLLGNVEFNELVWVIKQTPVFEADGITQATDPTTGALIYDLITINYGNFIQVFIEFIIIAFAVYATLNLIIRRKQFEERLIAEEKAKLEKDKPKEKVIPEDIKLLTEIRDLLKENEKHEK